MVFVRLSSSPFCSIGFRQGHDRSSKPPCCTRRSSPWLLCKHSAHDISHDFGRWASEEKPLSRFKHLPPLQKSFPCLKRPSDFIGRSFYEEAGNSLCLSFQFCEC